jgi:hypothetical protein
MKINETVYWHAKEGYQTIGYDGEEKDVLDIKLSNSDLPCEVVLFDGRGRLLLGHTEKPSDTAIYTHTYCISQMSMHDFAGRSSEKVNVADFIKKVRFATAFDIQQLGNKSCISKGWYSSYEMCISEEKAAVPNTDLIWEILRTVILRKEMFELVVPAEYDLIATFRSSVVEILKHVPYGLWKSFSFSVNESNPKGKKRGVVFKQGKKAENKDNEFFVNFKLSTSEEKTLNSFWKLLYDYCHDSDGSFRGKVYEDFESKYRGRTFPSINAYEAYEQLCELADTSCQNNWELFCGYSKMIINNKDDETIIKLVADSFRERISNLGDVLTSPESDFLQCETPSQLKESLDKLKKSLDKHSILLSALKDNGVTLDGATSKTLIERATELKGKEPKDILKETHDFYEELKTGDTHSRIREFLSNAAIERRMQKLEAENREASEKYLEDIKAKLETALLGTSGSSIDVHAGSNEKNENVGAGRDGACTGSKQGENRGSKRKGKQPSEPRKDEHDNVRAEEESQDKKNTCGSYDTGDLNADSSRGESDSLTAFNELLKEMKEYKEATVDEEIKKKYSNTVCEVIERIANGIETERFEKIVNCCKCVENFFRGEDIKRLEADCEKRKEADKQKESVLKSMTGFKAFIEWYCEKGKQVNWRGECIDRLRKNMQENVCVDCSVKDLMHAAQFVSGKYDIYEDQTVYDAVKLIIENGLVSIMASRSKTLADIREELLYLRYLKPEEGDEYTIKCLTEGYLAGSSGKKNSTQEEKIVNQGPAPLRMFKEKLPCRKETEFEIKLGVALDLIRKIEVSLNGDNARSGDSDSREAPDETSQFSGCSSRKNDASTWDECKNAQLKESCIRMLKECNLNENEKTELRRIENELRTEPGRSADRDHDTKSSNIRLIVILISLVLILSFAGIYLYNYFFAEDEEPIPTQPPATAQPTATTQPTVEPTVDPRESEWAKQLMKASIYMQKAQAERRKESKEFSRNSERLTSAPESNEPVTTAGSQQ